MLAALMSLRDAGDPLPAAAVCLLPMIDLAGTGESFRAANDPAVTAGFPIGHGSILRRAGTIQGLPLLSPLHGEWRGLPPRLVHVGGDEIVLTDATRLREDAQRAGVEVRRLTAEDVARLASFRAIPARSAASRQRHWRLRSRTSEARIDDGATRRRSAC